MEKKQEKMAYPVLPLRDIVVFPHMIVPLFVGRDMSVRALSQAMDSKNKEIFLVTQKDSSEDTPYAEDLYTVGTVGTVLQMIKLPDGTVKALVEGIHRAKVKHFDLTDDFLTAHVVPIDEDLDDQTTLEALCRTVISQFEQHVKLNRKVPPDILVSINQMDSPSKLVDTVSAYFNLKISEKQDLLETLSVKKRLERILLYIEEENNVLKVEKRIRNRVKGQMEKTQREYYLNEQLKAIHKELGDSEDGKDELSELEEKLRKLKLPKDVKTKAQAEFRKLRTMNASSAESTVVRNYLDWIVNLPWDKPSKIKRDLDAAQKILDRDHFGLEKVKERILEYLAVQARMGKVRGQILCLVGPPGVGKTSLGKSIAEATGRHFARISLGGVRDEAEIRGHRRTYIGAMPGKIIQSMKKAKTSNPLFLLDEIDKMGNDWRGDPASALLEVLDPEQNSTFNDHYLEVDYDLSNVMFVTTANTLKMPQPLLDRMEVIRIPGYTEDEKMGIAKNYLLAKQADMHGLKKGELTVNDDALLALVRYYTREAGVRSLEREIAKLCRKAVREIMTQKDVKSIVIHKDNLEKYAGVPRYQFGQVEQFDAVGMATGMAWTEVGGELLSIEAIVVPGKGKVQSTGKLGDVMQESVHAAMSYVRVRAHQFGLKSDIFDKKDIHIHVPEASTPKEGPSAGTAMCTAIVSAFTNIPIRKDVAMTGEITLRGRVLAIGGLKEKLLAAHRGGIQTVIIPADNEKDLSDIPANVKDGLTILPVRTMDDVLKIALVKEPVPILHEDDGPTLAPFETVLTVENKPTVM